VRELDEALVLDVWDVLCAWGPERSQAEAQAFIDTQPHLVALAEAVMEEFDTEAQKAAFGLLFLLAKVWEVHRGEALGPVSRERVGQAYEGTLRWMDRGEGADERFLARSGEFPQPHLIPYLITRFYQGAGGNDDYEAEIRGNLFLVLKAAADALGAVGAGPAAGDCTDAR